MKGLLIKDFCNLKKQIKLTGIFVILYTGWAVAMKMPSFIGVMLIFLSMTLPISSISYDEASQWYRYAFSLPISRRTFVLSKYVLGFLVMLACLVVSAIGNWVILMLDGTADAVSSWIVLGVCLEFSIIILSLCIPLLFQFGAEKARIWLVILTVAPSSALISLANFGVLSEFPLFQEEGIKALLFSSPLFTLAIFLISFRISVGICRWKEY